MRKRTLQTPRRRGRRCSRCWSRDSPSACGEDQGEAGCPPAAHGGPWWSRYPPAAPGGPHAGAGECPKEAVTPWRAHSGAGLLAGIVTPWGDPHWSSLFLRDCTHGKDPCYSSSLKTAAHGKDPRWSSSWRTVTCGRDTRLKQGKRARRKEQQRQHVMNRPQPHFLSPCNARGEEEKEIGSEVESGKKGGVWRRCF